MTHCGNHLKIIKEKNTGPSLQTTHGFKQTSSYLHSGQTALNFWDVGRFYTIDNRLVTLLGWQT